MDTHPRPLFTLLRERNTRQSHLAQRLGVRRTLVHAWCQNGVPPDRVAPICNALGLDAERAARFARDVGHPLPASVEGVLVKGVGEGEHV